MRLKLHRTTFSNTESFFELTRDSNNIASVGGLLTASAHGKMKRAAKIWLIATPTLVFLVSLIFGLLHHFYRYDWAGVLWYYTAMLLVAVIGIELLLITFER